MLAADASIAAQASAWSETAAPPQIARSSARVTAPGFRTRDWGLGTGDWLGIVLLHASVKAVQHSADAVGLTQHRVNIFRTPQSDTSREHKESLGFRQRAP